MAKIPYITTGVLVVLTALFAILNRYWTGFVYFVLVSLLLLSAFWGVWLIYLYCTDYQKELEEKFKIFRAQKINELNITSEVFDASLPVYKKEFKKVMFKERFAKWFVIAFCFATSMAFLIGMIFYN